MLGGNSSSWFAKIALEELEVRCLKTLKKFIIHYSRYVDNYCFLIVNRADINLGHNPFNNSYETLCKRNKLKNYIF